MSHTPKDAAANALITSFRNAVMACGEKATSKEAADYMHAHIALFQALTGAQPATVDDMCARIKAADDAAADRDYMLDSNDCISVLRGTWEAPLANDHPQPLAPPEPPEPEPHADDLAVDRFAVVMKDKLAAAREKGRSGWELPRTTLRELSEMLREHVDKGDPRDVANIAMFIWERGEAIVPAFPAPHPQLLAQLRKERDGWMEETGRLRTAVLQQRDQLELRTLHQRNDCWYWQGDAEDHPESFGNGMCIVIRGDQLRELVRKATAGPAPELVRAAQKALSAMVSGKRVLKSVGYSLDPGTIVGPYADALAGLRVALDAQGAGGDAAQEEAP